MDLSTNPGVTNTSPKTPVEEGQPTNVNADKEETPSTEGSKNEQPTQARDVKDACDSKMPVVTAETVSAETPVKASSTPGTTPSIAPPKTPESDCGSFCECDSPADSTGEAQSPQNMEDPKAATGSGHTAPGPKTEGPAPPTAAPLTAAPPTAAPLTAAPPTVPISEPIAGGVPTEQLTTTGDQLTATSDQLTATTEQLTATSQVQEVTLAQPTEQSETQAPATAQATTVPTKETTQEMHQEEPRPEKCSAPITATVQATTVPTKEPTEQMHQEEPRPEKCSAPVTTPIPVSKPSDDITSGTAPESVATMDSKAASEAEPTPVQVPKVVAVGEEVPNPAIVTATAPPTKPAPDSEPAPASPSAKESPPVTTPAPGPTQPKEPAPSSAPPSAPVTGATPPSISKPAAIPTPVPVDVPHTAPVGEPTSIAGPPSVSAAGSSTEAGPVSAEEIEKPSDLSCTAPSPPEKAEIAKENKIEVVPGVPPVNAVKDKEEKPEEEAMEVDKIDQSASGEKVGPPSEPQATALPSKLPTDAPPSMDDDSLSMGGNGDLKVTAAEEPMETESLVGLPLPGCSSEESSKDAPPLDFKPFSHYTEDGKLIDKEEEKTKVNVLPMSAHDVAAAALAATGESVSLDDSFPGRREELSESVKSQPGSCQPTEVSQFQGQFMDFLKCNDNATQHSFGADGKPLPPSSQGEATVGSEVTANGEATAQSEVTSDVPTTPQSGKRRKRRTKAQMMADRAAAAAAATGNLNTDEASNASLADSQKGSRSVRKRKQAEDDSTKDGQTTDGSPSKDGTMTTFPPEKLFEYQWPQTDKNSDWFFLQEHLSAFLGVKSFKRKYPTLERRPVSMPERNFLQESGVVSEMMCDLGLTALKSDQVYELMLRDFAEKYQQYAEVLHEREQVRRSQEKNKIVADMASVTKNNVVDVVKKAVRSAAEFNAQFMRERREERKAYFDMQTCEIHYPKSTRKVLPPALTKVSAYPVALIPGQFSEYYKRYTPQQMKYFPLNTCMYDPPRHLKTIYADPADKYESELDSQSASSQGDADDGSSSSGSSSGSGSDGDSDSSSDVEEKEAPAPTPAPTPAPPSNKKSTKTPRGKKQQQQQPQPQPPPEEEPFVARQTGVAVKDAAATMCNICQGTSEKNKIGEAEELVKCAECGRHGHPSCLELTIEMIPNIKTYPWQCMECKTCVECMDPYDEDKMMFCDHCDRGYHTFCVGLRSIPTGRWECPSCRPEPPASKKRRRQPPQKLETSI